MAPRPKSGRPRHTTAEQNRAMLEVSTIAVTTVMKLVTLVLSAQVYLVLEKVA